MIAALERFALGASAIASSAILSGAFNMDLDHQAGTLCGCAMAKIEAGRWPISLSQCEVQFRHRRCLTVPIDIEIDAHRPAGFTSKRAVISSIRFHHRPESMRRGAGRYGSVGNLKWCRSAPGNSAAITKSIFHLNRAMPKCITFSDCGSLPSRSGQYYSTVRKGRAIDLLLALR